MNTNALAKFIFALLPMVIGVCSCSSKKDEQLFVSCQNHRAQLNMDLNVELMGEAKPPPPYEAGVPGYEMIARYAGRRTGGLNCNHGAPHSRIGGWQAINLPRTKWLELFRLWSAREQSGIPFYWCGKPNRRQVRVFCTLSMHDEGRWLVEHAVVTESKLREQVEKLNHCLSELGQPPVEINVPDEIQWASFESKGER